MSGQAPDTFTLPPCWYQPAAQWFCFLVGRSSRSRYRRWTSLEMFGGSAGFHISSCRGDASSLHVNGRRKGTMKASLHWGKQLWQADTTQGVCHGVRVAEHVQRSLARLLLADLSPLLASSPAATPQHWLVPEGDALTPGRGGRGLFGRRKVFCWVKMQRRESLELFRKCLFLFF